MAVTQESSTALADSVKHDIRSTATTSESTFNLLRALLGLDLLDNPLLSNALPQPKKVNKASTRTIANVPAPKVKVAKPKGKALFEIHDAADSPKPPLPVDQRRCLATEVFNATLKQLSDGLKAKQNQAVSKQVQSQARTEASTEKVLRNRSPNRRPVGPTNGKHLKTAENAVNVETNLERTADCAMVSLQCLNNMCVGLNSSPGKPDVSLIRGSQILLEKLIGLGFGKKAIRQAWQLRRQLIFPLEQRWENIETKGQQIVSKSSTGLNGCLVEALIFHKIPEESEMLKIISSFQVQLLKVMLLSESSVTMQGLAGVLQPSNPFSPTAFILKLVDANLMAPDKAGEQLHALSQILSRICSHIRSQSSKHEFPPIKMAKLMFIMLEIRCRSWKLLGHNPNLQRELWVPLSRTLQDYIEAVGEKDPQNFHDVMKGTFNVRDVAYGAAPKECLPSSISNMLAELAQRCGCSSAALTLLEEQHSSNPDPSSLAEVIRYCKIATLYLDTNSSETIERLQSSERALERLKKSVKGTASELKELLLYGGRLRKAATAVAIQLEESMHSGSVDQDRVNLQTCAIRLIYAFLRFILRYLGQSSAGENNTTTSQRFSEDRAAISRSASHTVDAVLLIVKCAMVRSTSLWADTVAALNDSVDLASLLETINTSTSDKNPGMRATSTWLKVSNLYWGWYLQSKESGDKSKELCKLLENSVGVLLERSEAEQRQSFYVVKCERLSSLYIESKSYEKAQQALRCAIDSSIRQGVLDEAVKIVSVRPSRFAWSDPKNDANLLGSCLRKFAKNALNLEGTGTHPSPFYDNTNLSNLHRAQLLERQLFALLDQPSSGASKIHLVSLVEQILGFCQDSKSLVYRLRFIRDVLDIASKHPQFHAHKLLCGNVVQRACSRDSVCVDNTCLLASFGPVLSATVQLQWAFVTARPSPEWLQRIVNELKSGILKCSSASELAVVVDDSESLIRQLQAVADYAGMLDLLALRVDALDLVLRTLQHCFPDERQRRATCITHIASLQTRLGNTVAAGSAFAEAENLIANIESNADLKLLHGLFYAEYLKDLMNNKRGAEMLTALLVIYEEKNVQQEDGKSGWERFQRESQLAQATSTASALTFRQGDLASALRYARQCVKLTSGLWTALEMYCDRFRDQGVVSGNDSSMHLSTEESTNRLLSIDHAAIQSTHKGASFWPHVNIHFQALLRMSSLSAHCGLYQDAMHYAQQAIKLSKAVTCESRVARAQTALAVLLSKSGFLAEAQKEFSSVRLTALDRMPITEACEISLGLAIGALTLEDSAQANTDLLSAEDLISSFNHTHASLASVVESSPVLLEKHMSRLMVKERDPKRGAKLSNATIKSKNVAPFKSRLPKKNVILPSRPKSAAGASLLPSLQTFSERLAILRVQLQIRSLNPTAENLDMVIAHFPESRDTSAMNSFVKATLMVMQAMALLASDAVHCVLAETALAFPSKSGGRRSSGRVSVLSTTTVSTAANKKRAQTGRTVKTAAGKSVNVTSVPQDLVARAYHLLSASCSASANLTASGLIHDVQKLFNHLSILANALGVPLNHSAAKVVRDSLSLKDAILSRERLMIESERATAGRAALYQWPLPPISDTLTTNPSFFDEATETANFDDLPDSWSVVTISLNDDRTEFLLSRIVAGQSPFLLRIPLSRSAIEDADDGEFSFEDAKEELSDIIAKANATAHDSRGQADKEARKAWWSERELLNERLEALLANIEHVWLGGFRGILSQQQRSDPNLVFRFSNSLSASLDKHLPSRQKSGTSTAKQNVHLHAHVLDLFISLGHPELSELDDAITDLLYFVVDIHQFEGERNAYDEIDFDAILVDILDALRTYHDASLSDASSQHTILILDKELHAFPWESLPCLINKSVSRMPSLSSIRQRLTKIRAQSATASAYTIPSTDGAYILNPGADLPTTQSTFSKVFAAQLPTFTSSSITARRPTESEFENLLQSKSLLLYFGHGSGAQYIRGRRIKQLTQCAVTFLMGCSSGKMTECGEYESYGVPWNYMHGGAMAVVGTLWDVTDRDIDRFAGRVLTEWGLLEGLDGDGKGDEKARKMMKKMGRKELKAKDKTKGKGSEREEKLALDAAVARAREACILRYLNGAAVVLYGLPTLLG